MAARSSRRRTNPKKTNGPSRAARDPNETSGPTTLRIVGGSFRGRKIAYSGDRTVRPMKDRTREALFNLVGPDVKEMHAIDLFGGTGALAIESISRGAPSATIIERHLPSSRIIRQNLKTLDLEDRIQLIVGNAFAYGKKPDAPTDQPWLVFCCPPYRFFQDKRDELVELVENLYQLAPATSQIVVEAEIGFDFQAFPFAEWDCRAYAPALIGIADKLGPEDDA
ncbi:MAG: RsmD family RNA methyltransferase [Pirellulaceae bacterium]